MTSHQPQTVNAFHPESNTLIHIAIHAVDSDCKSQQELEMVGKARSRSDLPFWLTSFHHTTIIIIVKMRELMVMDVIVIAIVRYCLPCQLILSHLVAAMWHAMFFLKGGSGLSHESSSHSRRLTMRDALPDTCCNRSMLFQLDDFLSDAVRFTASVLLGALRPVI